LVGRKNLRRRAGNSQTRCPSLIVASLVVWAPLAGCSHSASNPYPVASQPGAASSGVTAIPPPGYPAAAASAVPTSPPPDEYDQARTAAYPSVSLADLFRNSTPQPPAPSSTTAAPPPGYPAPMGAAPTGQAAGASAPSRGVAPAPAAASPPPNEQDEALTAAYPSVSLIDIMSGKAH
jgi:hypothetical protein